MKKTTLSLLLLTLLLGCKKDSFEEVKVKLQKIDEIEDYPDSSLFIGATSMYSANDKIYILDKSRGDVASFDENFEEFNVFGKFGMGPEELNIPTGFFVTKDSVFVFDQGAGGIKLFTDSKYNKTIRIPGGNYPTRFFLYNDLIFSTHITENTNFVIADINDTDAEIKQIGEPFKFPSTFQTMIRNHKLLYQSDLLFFAVSDNLPIIQIYDLENYSLIEEFDYSNIPTVKQTLNFIKEKIPLNEKSYTVSINDAYLHNNAIFILWATRVDGYKVKTIFKFNIEGESLVYNKTYILPGEYYTTFCVSDKYIFAYNEDNHTMDKIELH
ncbi:hypothetical protein D0T49_05635 [Paludibacter sp. 221]|uniref:hypothetical protein n=1 Tax=Paludibacter sp. 221 TaxID=2302939 RepID=UPI0013D02899|nr:hypothetical protein [Paludibacter sp. 221]NDV46523.1 hypothetical protein [Paludibacter sp. 221]